ncbi:MAG: hypothetical protein EBT86_07505 [Actinobacteria bacterium]|nr:hypothetical protein [Actinomycetota bacterium]
MYTLEMATAFKEIIAPKNFGVVLYDADNFITLVIDPKDIEGLSKEEMEPIVKYINDVKKTLENLGAVVFVVRDSVNE